MESLPSTQDIVVRLALSLAAGGIIGLERQWQQKPAGLRTHMMVGLGAAAFTLIALELHAAIVEAGSDVSRVDPLRFLQGLVGGIGFLGAGTIIRDRDSVHGLTTAASIWVAGALGAACGGGHYVIAGVTAGLALLILLVLGAVEHRMDDTSSDPDQVP